MKNITLSIEEEVLDAGREYARLHNTSFNALVRKLIKQTVLPQSDNWLQDTFDLMDTANPSPTDDSWSRDELYRV